MGLVLTIAQRDFKGFFSTMRGSAILWFFVLFTGMFFWSFINTFIELQSRAPMMGGETPSLEQLISAVFQNIQFILLLVVPAVTMSSFSEDKRTKADRLLQTSPVSSFQIVLGKFIACSGVLFTVLLATTPLMIYLSVYGNPDLGPILTSYLGLFLLMCSQVAFGLWISSMSSNQFTSFIFTMFGQFLLLILNFIAKSLTQNEFGQGLIRYISSSNHLDPMLRGMISIGDVFYFVAFTSVFLFFSNFVLDSERWR